MLRYRPASSGWPLPDSTVAAKPNAPYHFTGLPSPLGNKDRQVGCRAECPVHHSLWSTSPTSLRGRHKREALWRSRDFSLASWTGARRGFGAARIPATEREAWYLPGVVVADSSRSAQILRSRFWITLAKCVTYSPSLTVCFSISDSL
jgi:hypothetical protein